MSIGIITFHRAVNYGAVFQAYALKKALVKQGVEAHIIDYRCLAIEEPYIPKIHWGASKQCLMDLLCFYKKKKKYDSFYKCVEKKLQPVDFSNIEFNSDIQTFITGSDQIWNYNITGKDTNYFLSFVPEGKKKISYAACSDKYEPNMSDTAEIQKYLAQMNAISVRDQETAEFVRKIIGENPTITVDPTFLLDEEDWDAFATTAKHQNYILVFSVGYSERLMDFSYNLAKQAGKQVIFINSGLRKKGRGVFLDTISPDEAIAYFRNADYVVTNSFHGTAMSLIFGREFFVELDHDKKGRNSRVEDMLLRFGVNRREIRSNKYTPEAFQPLDYKHISECIDLYRDVSRQWLMNALSSDGTYIE